MDPGELSATVEEAALSELANSKPERSAQEERKKVEKLVAGRLFFVRLPKPAELSTTDGLEADKDAIDAQLRKISDELQPIMAERSKAQTQLAETREVVRELKAQIEDKEMTLSPYQAEKRAAFQERETQRIGREEQRAAEKKAREDQFRAELNQKQKIKNDFSSQYGHLGVSNDDEIDEKIRALEFQQQHESLTINEEKALIKQIKQLQDSREAVRSYSQWSAQEKAEREAKQAQRKKQASETESSKTFRERSGSEKVQTEEEKTQAQEMAQLKAEVNSLWEEYKAQLDLRGKQQESDSGYKQQIDSLFERRDALRKEREEVWEKIQAHRAKVRAANQPYADNRSFSNDVRELVKKGQLQEARQLCLKQTEEMMGQYEQDSSFRSQYNKLWDASVDYKRPAPSASESHHKAAASVIAEALEAAKRSVASKSGKLKDSENRPSETNLVSANGLNAGEPTPMTFTASRPEIPGLDTGLSKPKPKKEKKQKQTPVELPKLDDTEFVPPPIAMRSSAGPSEEELKAQHIAHNKAAAAEAAMRKEKRKQAQEKKRQQKRQREELAKVHSKEDLQEDVSRPENTTTGDDSPLGGSEVEATPLAAVEGLSKPKPLNTRFQNSNAARAALNPKTRPFARRKGFIPLLKGYVRNAYSTAEERPLVAGLVTASVIILAIAPAIYHFS